MKSVFSMLLIASCSLVLASARGDTLVLSSGRSVSGRIVHTNGDELVLLTKHGTYNFARSSLKEIQTDRTEEAENVNAARLSDLRKVVLLISKQPWASNFGQIPATVIDKGILKNVPYVSFRCGGDYEVNVYGDLQDPAGIEAGVYHALIDDAGARENCRKVIEGLLGQQSDRETVETLKSEKDLKIRDGLTFEITPPSDEDAYQGWWVSVYSVQKLSAARASDEELKQITLAKSDVSKGKKSEDWSAQELKLARPDPNRISFTTKAGSIVTDAIVKPYVEGVSLIWRDDGGSGGIVKLADLPHEMQTRFGYDPAKTALAEAAEKEKQVKEAQLRAALAAQAPQAPATQNGYGGAGQSTYSYSGSSSPTGSRSHSTGGSVYVRGYYRQNGTYVHSYTRRR